MLKREHFQQHARGEIQGEKAGDKYVSMLDVSALVWQVPLDNREYFLHIQYPLVSPD